jgi:hypothetical protein
MTCGEARNNDNTDNKAEADAQQPAQPSGNTYTDGVLLVLRSMREAGRWAPPCVKPALSRAVRQQVTVREPRLRTTERSRRAAAAQPGCRGSSLLVLRSMREAGRGGSE